MLYVFRNLFKRQLPDSCSRGKSSVFAMIHLLVAVDSASIPSHSHCYPDSFIFQSWKKFHEFKIEDVCRHTHTPVSNVTYTFIIRCFIPLKFGLPERTWGLKSLKVLGFFLVLIWCLHFWRCFFPAAATSWDWCIYEISENSRGHRMPSWLECVLIF